MSIESDDLAGSSLDGCVAELHISASGDTAAKCIQPPPVVVLEIWEVSVNCNSTEVGSL